MSRETLTGSGHWQVIIIDGVTARVEIETGNRRLVIGPRPYTVACPACGREMASTTPDNEDGDKCPECEEA